MTDDLKRLLDRIGCPAFQDDVVPLNFKSRGILEITVHSFHRHRASFNASMKPDQAHGTAYAVFLR